MFFGDGDCFDALEDVGQRYDVQFFRPASTHT